MWWFWLALTFGGNPVQWAIAVGLFAGGILGYFALYRLSREESR